MDEYKVSEKYDYMDYCMPDKTNNESYKVSSDRDCMDYSIPYGVINKFIGEGRKYNENNPQIRSYLKFIKNFNNDKYHQLFYYEDEYGMHRYYTINTYDPTIYQCGMYKPWESLGFHSDENGNPLCEDNDSESWNEQVIPDAFNCGEINITGTSREETHLASVFLLTLKSHYFWDPFCHPNDDEDTVDDNNDDNDYKTNGLKIN